MILLNFAHPITPDQQAAIERLAGQGMERIISIPTQFDTLQPFGPQTTALVDSVGLTPEEWQTAPLLLNLPALSVIAALVLVEIHGRCGYFPAAVRLSPVANALPPRFEVAEILDLQGARNRARERRA